MTGLPKTPHRTGRPRETSRDTPPRSLPPRAPSATLRQPASCVSFRRSTWELPAVPFGSSVGGRVGICCMSSFLPRSVETCPQGGTSLAFTRESWKGFGSGQNCLGGQPHAESRLSTRLSKVARGSRFGGDRSSEMKLGSPATQRRVCASSGWWPSQCDVGRLGDSPDRNVYRCTHAQIQDRWTSRGFSRNQALMNPSTVPFPPPTHHACRNITASAPSRRPAPCTSSRKRRHIAPTPNPGL